MAIYYYTVFQAPLLFLGGLYFVCVAPSNFRRTLFTVIAPVALTVAVLGDAVLIAIGLGWGYPRVLLWHGPSFACAALFLLLYMTGWRRLWVTSR